MIIGSRRHQTRPVSTTRIRRSVSTGEFYGPAGSLLSRRFSSLDGKRGVAERFGALFAIGRNAGSGGPAASQP